MATSRWQLPKVDGMGPGPRGGHACVAVGDKVLLFGGSDRVPLTFDDLWVLETGEGLAGLSWTRITPMLAGGCKVMPRSGASLTAIGKLVYLFGGQEPLTEFRFGDLKVLDTETWTWSDVQVQGAAPPARHSHTATCLAGQCLLLYGGSGYSGSFSDVWVFNPGQGAWTQPQISGEAPEAREMHGAGMITGTRMLVYGGRGANGSVLCDAAVFDAQDMRWVAMEPTPFPRCAHSCAVLPRPATSPASASAAAAAAGTSAKGEEVGEALPCDGRQDGGRGGGGDDVVAVQGLQGAGEEGGGGQSGTAHQPAIMVIHGGFSGEAVEGDVLCIDGQTLEVEVLHRGPRESDQAGTVPSARFAAAAASLPGWVDGPALCVFGGVNPDQDLNDVALWCLGSS